MLVMKHEWPTRFRVCCAFLRMDYMQVGTCLQGPTQIHAGVGTDWVMEINSRSWALCSSRLPNRLGEKMLGSLLVVLSR